MGSSSHRIVGIALVVEEVGKGSKLVFKYPLEPQRTSTKNNLSSTPSNGPICETSDTIAHGSSSNTNRRNHNHQQNTVNDIDHGIDDGDDDIKDDIFFRFRPRVMAKLFRTKPPLCGQPVSLNIEGTIFCCRSVLLNPNQQHNQNHNSNHNSHSTIENLTDDMSTNSRIHHSASSGAGMSPVSSSNNGPSVIGGSNNVETSADGLVLFSIIVAVRPKYNREKNIFRDDNAFLNLNLHHKKTKESKFSNNNNSDIGNISTNGTRDSDNSFTRNKNSNDTTNTNKYNGSKNITDERKKNCNSESRGATDTDSLSHRFIENRVNERGSVHFPAIRRIHITLSRLCKVLEREEMRCLYVSRQVSHLLTVGQKQGESQGQIASTTTSTSLALKAEQKTTFADVADETAAEIILSSPSVGNDNTSNNKSSSKATIDDSISNQIGIKNNPIANAVDMFSVVEKSNKGSCTSADEEQQKLRRQQQRERLDLMLSAPPPPVLVKKQEGTDSTIETFQHWDKESIPIYGNLALELAQTFHALSRNSRDIRTSTSSLLSGRDGIVYINLHVAVKVEPATAENKYGYERCDMSPSSLQVVNRHIDSTSSSDLFPFLRPYHTLLFYPIAATEILRQIMKKSQRRVDSHLSKDQQATHHHQQGSNSLNLRRMEKLLLVADDPFKSLNDMATDAALPLPTIIETAKSLLQSGLCIAAPAMAMSTKFSCSPDVKLTASLTLEFAQHFGHHVPIFMVVSALTSPVSSTTKPTNKAKHLERGRRGEGGEEGGASSTTNKESVSSNDRSAEREKKSLITIGEVIEYSKLATREYQPQTEDVDDSLSINSYSSSNNDDLEDVPTIFRMLASRILKTSRTPSRVPAFLKMYEINSSKNSQIVENALISMTTWLRSRSIIIEQKEYLSSMTLSDDPLTVKDDASHSGGDGSNSLFFEDFISEKYQSCGNVSTIALAWKYGISLRMVEAFRDWGIREKKISCITRIPSEQDDWGAP